MLSRSSFIFVISFAALLKRSKINCSKGFWAFKSTNISSRNTSISLAQFSANLLKVFIFDHSIIFEFLLDVLGFYVIFAVSVYALVFDLFSVVKFIWKHTNAQCHEYFMTTQRFQWPDSLMRFLISDCRAAERAHCRDTIFSWWNP